MRRGQWNEDGAEDAAIKAVANSIPNGSAALLARIDAKLAVGGGPDRWLGERAREKAAAEAAAAEAAARAAEEEAARAAAQAAEPTPEVVREPATLPTPPLATTLTFRKRIMWGRRKRRWQLRRRQRSSRRCWPATSRCNGRCRRTRAAR
eukprot:COSAG04_NODE_3754_length_2558_cov_1.790565_2_plen_150_part_00